MGLEQGRLRYNDEANIAGVLRRFETRTAEQVGVQHSSQLLYEIKCVPIKVLPVGTLGTAAIVVRVAVD